MGCSKSVSNFTLDKLMDKESIDMNLDLINSAQNILQHYNVIIISEFGIPYFVVILCIASVTMKAENSSRRGPILCASLQKSHYSGRST